MANSYNVYESKEIRYREMYAWSRVQLDYMLGYNALGRSYLIGYGKNSVRNPHHKTRYVQFVVFYCLHARNA